MRYAADPLGLQEKRLSDLSNQSHDSHSTLSAASHEDRRNAASQRGDVVDGHAAQEDEEELDEMEVEYIEVNSGGRISSIKVETFDTSILFSKNEKLIPDPLSSAANCALCRRAHHPRWGGGRRRRRRERREE